MHKSPKAAEIRLCPQATQLWSFAFGRPLVFSEISRRTEKYDVFLKRACHGIDHLKFTEKYQKPVFTQCKSTGVESWSRRRTLRVDCRDSDTDSAQCEHFSEFPEVAFIQTRRYILVRADIRISVHA